MRVFVHMWVIQIIFLRTSYLRKQSYECSVSESKNNYERRLVNLVRREFHACMEHVCMYVSESNNNYERRLVNLVRQESGVWMKNFRR